MPKLVKDYPARLDLVMSNEMKADLYELAKQRDISVNELARQAIGKEIMRASAEPARE